MRQRSLTAIAMAAALMLSCARGLAQDPPPPDDGRRRDAPQMRQPPVLRVSGSAMMQAAPDHATVRLGATARAAEAAAAQDQVNQVMRRAIDAVRALGVEEKDIRTADLSLYPIHEQPQPMPGREHMPQEPRISGYQASNTIVVELTDLSRIGPVIDAVVNAGANQLQGVHFSLQNDTEARAAALEKAVADARRKAEALARAAGVQLGPIMEIAEGGAYVQPPMPMGYARGAAMEMAAPTPVQPGQLDVHASVTMVFHLRGGGEAPPPGREPAPREGERPREGDRSPRE